MQHNKFSYQQRIQEIQFLFINFRGLYLAEYNEGSNLYTGILNCLKTPRPKLNPERAGDNLLSQKLQYIAQWYKIQTVRSSIIGIFNILSSCPTSFIGWYSLTWLKDKCSCRFRTKTYIDQSSFYVPKWCLVFLDPPFPWSLALNIPCQFLLFAPEILWDCHVTRVLLGVVFLVHVCSGKCMLSRVELLHLLYTNRIPEFHAEFSCKLLICQVGYLHQITSFYFQMK